MGVRLFRIVIQVGDINAAQRFYATTLGGPGMRVSEGRHYFDCGGVLLACVSPAAEGDSAGPQPTSDVIYFSTANLEGSFAACRAAGADFDAIDVHGDPGGQIARRPWGERSFYVKDPWGNSLCFVAAGTEFTGRGGTT